MTSLCTAIPERASGPDSAKIRTLAAKVAAITNAIQPQINELNQISHELLGELLRANPTDRELGKFALAVSSKLTDLSGMSILYFHALSMQDYGLSDNPSHLNRELLPSSPLPQGEGKGIPVRAPQSTVRDTLQEEPWPIHV